MINWTSSLYFNIRPTEKCPTIIEDITSKSFTVGMPILAQLKYTFLGTCNWKKAFFSQVVNQSSLKEMQ